MQIRSFSDAVADCEGRVDLAKIDVEGAEFEILEQTPLEVWRNVGAISIEIHDDPQGKLKLDGFLGRLKDAGYSRAQKEPVASASYFLCRG